MKTSLRGSLAAIFAYGTWGLFPVYFKLISAINPVDVIAWRVLLCFIFLFLVLLIWLRPAKFIRQLKSIDQWWLLLASAILLAINWLVFVYAVKTDQVLQSSMGYFLVPIISVGLGMLVFSERPNRLKLFAVVLAAVGMLLTFIVAGEIPWIALVLGITFGIYGMCRKKAKFDSTIGLFLETVMLLPIAILYLLFWTEPLSSFDTPTRNALYLLGVVTTVPLVAMLFAARRIELSALGFYQYITPSVQLVLAVLIYNETLDLVRTMALVTTLVAVFFWLCGSWVTLSQRRKRAQC